MSANDTVVVGAQHEDSNATGLNANQANNSLADSGAAYVFTGLWPAPQLGIERSADNVRILWPISAANFVLEEAGELGVSPIAWT